jgi:hypothetical protein
VKPQAQRRSGPVADGYTVVYAGGYKSWSPKAVFEAAYQPITAMNFSHALAALKHGHRVARKGWNGKGMFIYLVAGSRFAVNRQPLSGIYAEGTEIDYRPHIDMKDAEDKCAPWLASQADMLAEDWMIVESDAAMVETCRAEMQPGGVAEMPQ